LKLPLIKILLFLMPCAALASWSNFQGLFLGGGAEVVAIDTSIMKWLFLEGVDQVDDHSPLAIASPPGNTGVVIKCSIVDIYNI